eukprot:RCo050163
MATKQLASKRKAGAAEAVTTRLSLPEAFNRAQGSVITHVQLFPKLQAIQHADPPGFLAQVVELLKHVLLCPVTKKGEQYIMRFTQFLCGFCRGHQENSNALSCALIKALLGYSGAKEKNVRHRACQLLGALMDTLHASENDNDEEAELYDEIISGLRLRLHDAYAPVRVQAVQGLYRLHDPSDPNDDITQALLLAMAEDSCPDVRKIILTKLRISPVTLPHITRMTRDIDRDVRRRAFDLIKQGVPLRKLKIAERVQLLKHGLADREADVRKAASELCTAWLKSVNWDPVEFLSQLDVEVHLPDLEQTIQFVIDHLRTRRKIHGKPDGESPTAAAASGQEVLSAVGEPAVGPEFKFDREAVTSESAVYWRMVCTRLKTEKKESLLEEQLGCLSDFADFLLTLFFRGAAGHPDDEGKGTQSPTAERSNVTFVCTQVLRMCPLFDFGDEAGRRKLSLVLGQILGIFAMEHPDQYIKPIIATLRCVHHDSFGEFMNAVQSGIVTLRADGSNIDAVDIDLRIEEQNLERARKQSRLNELRARLGTPRSSRLSAEDRTQVEADIDRITFALYRDQALWARCLFLIIEVLEGLPRNRRDIPDSFSRVILAASQQHDNAVIFELAVRALGLLCMVDLVTVPTYLPIFLQALRHFAKAVREVALKACFDIFLIWGTATVEQQVQALTFPPQPAADQSMVNETVTPMNGSSAEHPALQKSSTIVSEVACTLLQYLAYGEPVHPEDGSPIAMQLAADDESPGKVRAVHQYVATEGFAKLLSCNKWSLEPERVLAQFLLNYHNPDLIVVAEDLSDAESSAGEDEEAGTGTDSYSFRATPMRQFLQPFLSAYSASSHARQRLCSFVCVL